jgi:hypothetical protein
LPFVFLAASNSAFSSSVSSLGYTLAFLRVMPQISSS